MNEKEELFDETFWWVFPAGVFAIGAIQFFVDPFDYKRRPRTLRPPPPWS
jgi:hypothetical protein